MLQAVKSDEALEILHCEDAVLRDKLSKSLSPDMWEGIVAKTQKQSTEAVHAEAKEAAHAEAKVLIDEKCREFNDALEIVNKYSSENAKLNNSLQRH